ncbi:MAG: hypothetical protein ACXQT4_04290 [Methanotrichaceae archaeon]
MDEPAKFCKDLKKFIMTFVFATAESIQATQGSGGLMVMSVAIGSRLWDELEAFAECTMPHFETRDEMIDCFMNTLKKLSIIGGYSFFDKDGHIEVEIRDCFFAPASNKQIEKGLKHPICPIGGIIVAGLHKTSHILTTLEKIEHDPKTGTSVLTFKLHP